VFGPYAYLAMAASALVAGARRLGRADPAVFGLISERGHAADPIDAPMRDLKQAP
jgi:hypothetical protein